LYNIAQALSERVLRSALTNRCTSETAVALSVRGIVSGLLFDCSSLVLEQACADTAIAAIRIGDAFILVLISE
jgi:hypothetical protein